MLNGNMISDVIVVLFMGLWILALAGMFVKLVFAPVKTIKAVVVDKHIVERFSAYSGNGKREKYAVVFSVDGREKMFYVSQFSYNGYWIGEEGLLTYKGGQIVEFK